MTAVVGTLTEQNEDASAEVSAAALCFIRWRSHEACGQTGREDRQVAILHQSFSCIVRTVCLSETCPSGCSELILCFDILAFLVPGNKRRRIHKHTVLSAGDES